MSDTVFLSIPQAEYRLKRLAYDYLHSYPGPDEAAKNHFVHNSSHKLLRGRQLSEYDLETLAGALRYRMNSIMARATEYKDRLGIVFGDCRNTDVFGYTAAAGKDMAKFNKWGDMYHLVVRHQLFDSPLGHEGMSYEKGTKYLAVVLTESGWSRDKIESALDELVKLKSKQIPWLSVILLTYAFSRAGQLSKYEWTVRTFRFREDPNVREMVGTLAKSTKKRLRSLSPVNVERNQNPC